jgi:ferredoxin
MLICDVNDCTGCFACANVCKHNAIQIVENKRGFLYPSVDDRQCLNCGLCKKACQVNNPMNGNHHIGVYAALVKNDIERAKSSSGGIFAALATRIIKKGGYVYGAAICEDFVVRHIEVHSLEELEKLRTSKYVAKRSGMIYQHVQL